MTATPPIDLHQAGRVAAEALRRSDHATARPLLERVVQAFPTDINGWFGLAIACRGLGDDPAQLAALDRVLAAKADHLLALMMKADHFAKVGDDRAAEAFYRAVVAAGAAQEPLTPEVRGEVQRAARLGQQYGRAFEAHLQDTLAKAGFDPASSSRRFAQGVELLLGEKEIYYQAPAAFYFPELPLRQFYERSEFAWLPALEAQTDAILAELQAILDDDEAFSPYVKTNAARPPKEFGTLRDNPSWSAFHLIENGLVNEAGAARCPATMAALREVPLSQSPGRTPSVMFSLLHPGTNIPPHNGLLNTRLICHLPLITPDRCGLRVGNEARPWLKGQTLIFDDSIEHQAWNNGDQLRVVLLFDIWRPELTAEERDLVSAMLSAVGDYGAD